MTTLYKEDQTCNADESQVAIMEKAGWSRSKPDAVPEEGEKVEATKTSTKTAAPAKGK